MILVTGAAGKTGQAVITALMQKGGAVRALVRVEAQVTLAREAGAREVVVGDIQEASMMRLAANGVRAIYHICPNMHPDEFRIGQNMMAAAQSAGIQHFVFHSVLHPQTEKMPHHWHKLMVEEMLFESGLPFTILQPTAYMQNLLASWPAISGQGLYTTPYPVTSRLSLVDLQDVGEVAAKVLTESDHIGANYELSGTKPLAQTDVSDILSQQLQRPVIAQEIALETWRAHAESAGVLSAYAIETLVKMFRYYANYGLEGNPRVLGFLLGRGPTSLSDFVKRVIAERRD